MNKIDAPFEAFYINGLLFNATSALNAIDRFEALEKPNRSTNREALNCLHEMAQYAGSISRFFWPPEKKCKNRGEQLRDAFQIKDDNPLACRSARNSIEHFDERLDTFFSQGFSGCILPEYVGESGDDGGVPTAIFRAYYTDTDEFHTMNDSINVTQMRDSLLSLKEQLVAAQSNGEKLPRN